MVSDTLRGNAVEPRKPSTPPGPGLTFVDGHRHEAAGPDEPETGDVVVLESTVADQATCSICGEPVSKRVVRCFACNAPFHPECWDFTGGCGTYGCSGNAGPSPPSSVPADDGPVRGRAVATGLLRLVSWSTVSELMRRHADAVAVILAQALVFLFVLGLAHANPVVGGVVAAAFLGVWWGMRRRTP